MDPGGGKKIPHGAGRQAGRFVVDCTVYSVRLVNLATRGERSVAPRRPTCEEVKGNFRLRRLPAGKSTVGTAIAGKKGSPQWRRRGWQRRGHASGMAAI